MGLQTRIPLSRDTGPNCFGCGSIRKPKPTTRDHPLASDEACHDLIEHFYKRGGRELDTARVYQNGNCEAMLDDSEPAKKSKSLPNTITT